MSSEPAENGTAQRSFNGKCGYIARCIAHCYIDNHSHAYKPVPIVPNLV